MKATLEISMYPLTEDYINVVVDFINEVGENYQDIRVHTNGLSTQVFADYDTIMEILANEVKEYLEEYKSVFVFKLASGAHTPESVNDNIKNKQYE